MKKMIINVSSLEYSIDSGEPCYPLPLGVEWRGEIELIGRLRRTRGKGADWQVSNIEVPLGNSPRIYLSGFGKVKTARFCDISDISDIWERVIVTRTRGYEGRRFCLCVSFQVLQDLSRRKERADFIQSVSKNVDKRNYIHSMRQGHLRFWALSWTTPELPEWLELPSNLVLKGKRTRILNHELVAADKDKELHWVAYDYSMVVHAPGTRLHVVSPDHLDEANTLPQGCYFFTHPEPSAD